MSPLESAIWHILGYLAMPTIFLIGFVCVALVTMGLIKMMGHRPMEADREQD